MLASVFTKTSQDRWKGMAIGVLTFAVLLLFGMAVYREIDVSVYTAMPEAFLSLMSIPQDADVASLAYGAIYSSYGALTMAAIALSMGSASIAGEEQKGTIGLLLGNPTSRTSVLASKAASMVFLLALGSVFLWLAGLVAPEILNVDIGGMHIGALVVHMFTIALFFGFMALAIGAWTGSPGASSGVTAGVMFVSFVGAGLFPLIEGLENIAKVFPWYYYSESQPVNNGVDWPHLGVLWLVLSVFAIVSIVGVNRRDLRGRTSGVSVLDKLRNNPVTHRLVDRLAGSARVSQIWVKTASEHQGLLFVTAALMFFMMGVIMGPMYTLIDDTLLTFADQLPEVLLALFGGGDMSTPEGFYQVETFGMMAPIAVMVVTVAIGSRAMAGEEENRTMGLLLANPIKRSKVVFQKTFAMVLYAIAVGLSIFAGVTAGSILGGLGMDIGNIAATSLLVTLVGVVFGALALALGAAAGRVRVAVYGTIGIALVAYIFNAFIPHVESLAGYAKWSPFYYYLSSDPLNNGMAWGHGAVLAGLASVLIGLSVVLFDRRDLV